MGAAAGRGTVPQPRPRYWMTMSSIMELRPRHRRLGDLSGPLLVEFRGVLPAGTVLRCVAGCRSQLRRAGVRAGLDVAVEAMARHRLRALDEGRAAAV